MEVLFTGKVNFRGIESINFQDAKKSFKKQRILAEVVLYRGIITIRQEILA